MKLLSLAAILSLEVLKVSLRRTFMLIRLFSLDGSIENKL